MPLFDLIDDIVHLLDLRTYWRIYCGAVFGFLLVFILSLFLPREAVSILGIICCISIPTIFGGIWHGISHKGS